MNPPETGEASTATGQSGETVFRLFDPADVDPDDVVDYGTAWSTVCGPSRAIATPGALVCVPSTELTAGAMVFDPCFPNGSGAVLCAQQNGAWSTFSEVSPTPASAYSPSVSDLRSAYPWRMRLSSGEVCLWDWWESEDRGEDDQDLWACVDTEAEGTIAESGGAMVVPRYGEGMLPDPSDDHDLLAFDNVLVMDWTQTRVLDLDQRDGSTWYALVERADGVFTRTAVAEAWY